ncbi:MAG: GatB/YqeY domain-containing protein [Sinobacterium sp.]|nr:GatB/YqeY domain-containing protein [Sinobacterium sp.]
MSEIVANLKQAMKAAMRAKEKERLTTIRMIQAELKRIEIDERIDIDDARALAVMDKMIKQRRDAAKQYTDADRPELAEKENSEIAVIQDFLPSQLSDDEINTLIDNAISQTGAAGMQDMGKVMGLIKPQAQGRADMGNISQLIKARLNS